MQKRNGFSKVNIIKVENVIQILICKKSMKSDIPFRRSEWEKRVKPMEWVSGELILEMSNFKCVWFWLPKRVNLTLWIWLNKKTKTKSWFVRLFVGCDGSCRLLFGSIVDFMVAQSIDEISCVCRAIDFFSLNSAPSFVAHWQWEMQKWIKMQQCEQTNCEMSSASFTDFKKWKFSLDWTCLWVWLQNAEGHGITLIITLTGNASERESITVRRPIN